MLYKFNEILPTIGKDTFIAPSADVLGDCIIGDDCSVWFGVVIRGDVNKIRIGDRTNVQDLSMLHVTQPDELHSDGAALTIGNDVTIAHKVMLHGCTIGNTCLIGMNAVVLDGAEIGDESIVGAGSLVTKNKKFPPRSLIMGSPAKAVRTLNDGEIKTLHISSKNYQNYKNQYLKQDL